jgi:hypothetical protein
MAGVDLQGKQKGQAKQKPIMTGRGLLAHNPQSGHQSQ